MRWTWFVERDNECWSETFDSPEKAVAAMAERQGWDENVPERMAQLGMYLASVRVTVTPLMVLRPPGVATVPPTKDRGVNG
jgi:hypothetical protein